jgi:hypothetical protein
VWIHIPSRCFHFSAGRPVWNLEPTSSAGSKPSATSSPTPTPRPFSCPECEMSLSMRRRYGAILKHLTGGPGPDLFQWLAAVSRAKTCPTPESAPASKTGPAPASGPNSTESFAKLNHDGSWSRMCQGSSQLMMGGGLEEFSETWPRRGMMRNGTSYRLPMSARRTSESASGLWRTPTAEDCQNRAFARNSRGEPKLSAQVKMWPSPRGTDGSKGGPNQRGSKGDLMLPSAVHLWPTPTSADGLGGPGTSPNRRGGANLRTAVAHSASQGLPDGPAGGFREADAQASGGLVAEYERCGRTWWSVEPDVGRVAHGVAFRVDRLRCCGNGVVPQSAAAWAWKKIAENK